MKERVINMYISNNSISLVHPLAEETILTWRLSQIVSFVFNETEFSFSICSKCNKCSGRFAQVISLETGIFIVSSLEERLASIYPGEKLSHEKTISGDIYKVPHSCKRIDKEGIYFPNKGLPSNNSKLISLACIPLKSPKPAVRTQVTQPKYKRCPTPTSFIDGLPGSPSLPFTRHSSVPPTQSRNHGYDSVSLYAKSALASPASMRSFRVDNSVSFNPCYSQEDIISATFNGYLPKSPSLTSAKYTPQSKPFKQVYQYQMPRTLSQHWSNPPVAPGDWNYATNTAFRSRHGSLGAEPAEPMNSPFARKSLTPVPNLSRIHYPEESHNKLSIISELDRSYQSISQVGYESHSLPIRRNRLIDHRPRPSVRSNTFQFPIGSLSVKLTKEPNFSEGGNIIINETEYQIPRMIPDVGSENVYDIPSHLVSDPSSDTGSSTPPDDSYNMYTDRNKSKRLQTNRKDSINSSNISSTTLSECLPFSQEDSDSGPDRITLL